MARLSDIPKVYRSVGVIPFFRRVYDEMSKDNLMVWASALAYSWLFAIFPFFVFLLALLPYMPARAQEITQTQIKLIVADQLPRMSNNMVVNRFDDYSSAVIRQRSLRGPTLYLGLFVALWAASSGTSMTMSSLDRCYELEKGRSVVRQRLVAILLTIVVAIMLLAIMCLLPIATALRHWLIAQGVSPGQWELVLFDVARWILSLVLMILVLTLIYYNGPAIRHHFCFITPGALFVLIVWILLGIIFRVYIDHIGAQGYSQTYGTVGGVVILLFFFYLDALVLLVGAEINAEVDFEVLRVRRGSNDFRRPEDFSDGAPMCC
jgi:membrane protein